MDKHTDEQWHEGKSAERVARELASNHLSTTYTILSLGIGHPTNH